MARPKAVSESNGVLISTSTNIKHAGLMRLGDEPPGVIMTVAKLVPAAIDALPNDEYEARIADYQRRIEAGLPTPLFGCEQPQVPDAESLGKTLIQCWACGLIAGRAGNQCQKANDGLRRWESRMHGANTTEIYCPECFDVWGWPDEYLREVERYNRMSDECARAEELARGALAPTFNALDLVPDACAGMVSKLFLCNSNLLQTTLALCSTIRVYLDETNLTPDDVNAICRRLLQPDVRAKHRGHWDVMADLSAFVAEAVARNNARDAAEDREAERKEFAVKNIAADLFQL